MHSLGNPEADLMILGARDGLDGAVLDRMRECVRRCSRTDYFLRLCFCHKVYPFVLQWMERLDPSANPAFLGPVMDAMGRAYSFRWPRNRLRIRRTMSAAWRAMQSIETPFPFLKGVWLADEFHQDPMLPVCRDVDILIPEARREEAVAALLQSGFQFNDTMALQQARNDYEGQAELRHPRWRVLLDVNWLLTGNAGIGKVNQNLARIWERAQPVKGALWRLSNEDILLNLIRHVGHGHDFEDGFIQCCADVTAVLRKAGDSIDWVYLCEAAKQCECLRVVRFFAHFYDQYYRDETMPLLSGRLPSFGPRASERERRLFAKWVQAPLVRRKVRPKTTTDFVNGNLSFAGKLWALDRLRRLMRIVLLLPWPSKDEVIMLTLESRSESLLWRRIRYYFNPLLPGLPGVFLGTAARLCAAIALGLGGLTKKAKVHAVQGAPRS